MTPYPKPLSVIVDPNAPKEQQNPVEAGLNVVDPEDRGYKLTRIVLISRDEQAKDRAWNVCRCTRRWCS